MPITLSADTRDEAVASIQAYAQEHLPDELGTLAATSLLDFVLKEIGPSIYNQAVRDVQERLHAQIAELDVDVHEPEFGYWPHRRKR